MRAKDKSLYYGKFQSIIASPKIGEIEYNVILIRIKKHLMY